MLPRERFLTIYLADLVEHSARDIFFHFSDGPLEMFKGGGDCKRDKILLVHLRWKSFFFSPDG